MHHLSENFREEPCRRNALFEFRAVHYVYTFILRSICAAPMASAELSSKLK